MNAILKIKDASGRSWEFGLDPGNTYTIGRAKENDIILNDRRVSRRHAHILSDGKGFIVVDGFYENGALLRSVNHLYVNGAQALEKQLQTGEIVTIGESKLEFDLVESGVPVKKPTFDQFGDAPTTQEITPIANESQSSVRYDDQPLGHTQVQISLNEIIGKSATHSTEANFATPEEIKDLRRKAQSLEVLYEMSKTLGSVFDLKEIFAKATELIFRGTPAERVVALLADETVDGKILDYSLFPIAIKGRDAELEDISGKLSISRTITQKVMNEKCALLSQDAATDKQFMGAESIVSSGVRSTICAPLVTESNVHGVVYADRFDPFSAFSQNDLELISAVAAQTAVAVETIKAHKRLAREEVARANYSRFMPEYVVKQLLENPDSFKLGGTNQMITVLFADIRGFTSFSEKEKPEKVVGLLNRYFSAMSEIIFAHGGTLDKYIGDGLMALFGAPTATPDDANNALRTAVTMQKRIVELNKELQIEGYASVNVGIGLHTGEATIGYIGSEQRSEYTAIGDTVNIAARLESNAKAGQILASESTARFGGEIFTFTALEPLNVKNRLEPVPLFEVKWN